MAYDFPANPTEDQEYTPPVGGQTYVYKAPRWLVKGVPPLGGDVSTGIDEAPVDGQQYARQSAVWSVVVHPTADWATITGKPVTFPPTLPIPWADVSGKPSTFPPALPIAWSDVSGKPATFPPTLPIQITDVTGLFQEQADQNTAISTKLPIANYTAADVMTKVSSLDGTGSGLDADLLDGQHGSYYLDWNSQTGKPATFPPTLPIAWTDVSGKPTTFPPTLPIAQSDVTNLVADIGSKEPTISAGSQSQYWRGDKTWHEFPPTGVTDAPSDGTIYGRKDATWVSTAGQLPSGVTIADAAPAAPMVGQMWFESDTGNLYIWYDDGNTKQWVHVSGFAAYSFGAGGGIAEAPTDSKLYARYNTEWIQIGTSGGVPEAPIDGKQYVRKNGSWQEVVFPEQPVIPMVFDTNGDAVVKFGSNIVIRIKNTGLILTKDDIEVFSTTV